MEKLFNNLYIYEIVLLFLGIFLFMLLCVALAYLLYKGENIKKLLYFFVVSIIMIGYPSIQEIQIENDKIAFTKYKEQVRDNPNDTTALANLEKLLPTIESRSKSPDDLIQLSEAYVLTENSQKAIEVAEKGIKKEATINESETLRQEHISSFKNVKEAATLQKEIIQRKSSDSLIISKEQLQKIKKLNPKTRNYFNQKYTTKSVIRNQ